MRAIVVLVVLLPAMARAAATPAGFLDAAVATGLDRPTALAFLPDGRILVTEQGGRLVRIDGGAVETLATIPVCDASEMGLLGVAADPDFRTNGFVYLYRTSRGPAGCSQATGRTNQVVRVTVRGDAAGSLTVLLDGIRTDEGNHDGGAVRVGPDRKLYVGTGDSGLGDNQGGPGSATNPYAQDLSSLNGKILRLERDGSAARDNPFVHTPGARPEVFAYGFRNPFRLGFDPATGHLWAGDVGDLTVEEIDVVVAGGNYGWPYCEGTLPPGCEHPGDIDPVFSYEHDVPDSLGETVIGGGFAPAGFGSFDGFYFFADWAAGTIYDAPVGGPNRTGFAGPPGVFITGIGAANGGPVDVQFGPDGNLYYVQFGPGEIHRVAALSGDLPLAGRKLVIRADRSGTSRTALSVRANSSVDVGIASRGPAVGEGSLRIVGAGFDRTYPLPSANWRGLRRARSRNRVLYRDADGAAGPIRTVAIRAGRVLTIAGNGTALGLSLASDPRPVDVVLTLDGRRYCVGFGGTIRFRSGVAFTARNAPPPASCP